MAAINIPEIVGLLIDAHTDTWNIEAKEARHGLPDTLNETLSAFANMPEGGTIVLGVAEVDGEMKVTGVGNPRDLMAGLASKAREKIHPPIQLGAMEVAKIDGKNVVACVIPPQPSDHRPFRVGNAGPAYTRAGDGDYQLSELEEQYLVGQRAQPVDDRAPVPGASVEEDLDPQLLEQYLQEQKRQSRRLSALERDELLVRTNVVDHETGLPTVAAVYAFGIHPQQFLPHLAVKCHARGEHTRLEDKQEFSGPVPDLMESVTEWVSKHLMHGVTFDGGHGYNRAELPMVAIREIVANALVHRDLSVASSGSFPMVVKLPTKLIVENPGGLWGLTERELGHTSPRTRNAILYNMCSSITTESGRRIIEGHATGIPAVRRALHEAFLPDPYFKDEVIKFRAVLTTSMMLSEEDLSWLASLPGADTLTVAQKHALVAMKSGTAITNSDYRAQFPMDSVQARNELQQLVQFGLAENTGTGRGSTYQLSSPTQQVLPPSNGEAVTHALQASPTPLTRNEIAAATGLTSNQVYRSLQKNSHIQRVRDLEDKRVIRYYLES